MLNLSLSEVLTSFEDSLQTCAGRRIIPRYNYEPLADYLVENLVKPPSKEALIFLFLEISKRFSACGGNSNDRFAVMRKGEGGWGYLEKEILDLPEEILAEESIPEPTPRPVPPPPPPTYHLWRRCDNPTQWLSIQATVLAVTPQIGQTQKSDIASATGEYCWEYMGLSIGEPLKNPLFAYVDIFGDYFFNRPTVYPDCATCTSPDPTPPPATGNPVIGCSESFSKSGGMGGTSVDINFGITTGSCGINFNAASVPDRFQIWYDGVLVADSLFVGSTTRQQALLDLGYTLEELNLGVGGSGELRFNKANALPSIATIVVNAPFDGTYWSFSGVCPQ